MEMTTDGTGRDAKYEGDLGGSKFLPRHEEQHFSLLGRQRIEGGTQFPHDVGSG
jgi:hypothetical protein